MDNNNHFKSLNSTLPEFYLEKLEERLETDPLTTGGLLGLEQGSNPEECFCLIHNCDCDDLCTCDTECHDYETSCRIYA